MSLTCSLPTATSTKMSEQTISVQLDGSKTADLQVEEFVYSDLSYGQYESGWRCYDLNTDTEYFVSEEGSVYVQPENRCVGVAPVIKERADLLDALMTESGGLKMERERYARPGYTSNNTAYLVVTDRIHDERNLNFRDEEVAKYELRFLEGTNEVALVKDDEIVFSEILEA